MNYDNDFGIKQSISIVRSPACQALPMESFQNDDYTVEEFHE